MSARPERRGLTLLELLVALAIAGTAMLGGVMLLDQIRDSARRITVESRRNALEMNGERLLRRLLMDARQTSDTAGRFRGDERNASYLAMCDTPGGWPEQCRVLLSIASSGDSSTVVAETARGARFTVRRTAGHALFRYLDRKQTADSAWLQQWMMSIALPAAFALVTPSDTTVFPLGSIRD
jgi:prepilin-type N-terminal cleavage/methylation domain-containing protein